MLLYQPIKILIYALYLCNTLTTTKNRLQQSHDESKLITIAFQKAEKVNINI